MLGMTVLNFRDITGKTGVSGDLLQPYRGGSAESFKKGRNKRLQRDRNGVRKKF